jgi:hypothetical protein
MPTTRITEKTRNILRVLSNETGNSMQVIIEQAIERYRRHVFLERNNQAFAALKANTEAWKEEQEERALWDNALNDGQEDN